ncbi:hypothetical protein COO91_05822 [Nostoc flagelliforme CCNUN1]|uniref:Uncharacterized protein n=1 Tax=Nostoc flagelliforme CCNUN1 TaxID=2038116 RepID=A0A2K8SWK2_9NOSO|nr:hypothetical protein COO91_05822 [Nostoc flagelliforme CCNUN1]
MDTLMGKLLSVYRTDFFPVSEKYERQVGANKTFQGRGKPLPSQ